MNYFEKSVKSIIASMLLVMMLINPIAVNAEEPEILAISEDGVVAEEDLDVDILDGVEEDVDLDVDILDGVEEEHNLVVEPVEDVKEKHKSTEDSNDIYDLGKGVTFYGYKSTSKRLNTDIFFDPAGDSDFNIVKHWSNGFSTQQEEMLLSVFKDFVANYLPKEYGNLDVFFTPVVFEGVYGFYSNFKDSDRKPSISVAEFGISGRETLFHEMGHHVKYVYYDKGKGNFNDYKKIFDGKELRKNPDGDNWSTLITESFAEDFSTYIKYSFDGYTMERANKFKRTIYPFTEEVVELFDDLFPEIKKERLMRSGQVEEVIKMTRGQEAINNASFSNWAKQDIYSFHYNGLKLNHKNYTDDLTRDQFANMALQIYELKKGEVDEFNVSFDDTNADYISKAAELNIIKGVGGNKFLPDEKIKREDMYLIVDRLSTLLNKEIELDRTIKDRDTTLEEGVAIINRFL